MRPGSVLRSATLLCIAFARFITQLPLRRRSSLSDAKARTCVGPTCIILGRPATNGPWPNVSIPTHPRIQVQKSSAVGRLVTSGHSPKPNGAVATLDQTARYNRHRFPLAPRCLSSLHPFRRRLPSCRRLFRRVRRFRFSSAARIDPRQDALRGRQIRGSQLAAGLAPRGPAEQVRHGESAAAESAAKSPRLRATGNSSAHAI